MLYVNPTTFTYYSFLPKGKRGKLNGHLFNQRPPKLLYGKFRLNIEKLLQKLLIYKLFKKKL